MKPAARSAGDTSSAPASATVTGLPSTPPAGACAASGLLELARHAPAEADELRRAAVRLLEALDTRCGQWNSSDEGLLAHGSGSVPEGRNIDVPLIYGDYFFVEALARLRGCDETFW